MTGDTPLQASLSPRQVLVWDGGEEEGGWKRQEMTAPDPELHLLSGSAPADEVTLRARDLSAEDGHGLTSSHPQTKTGQDTGLATR